VILPAAGFGAPTWADVPLPPEPLDLWLPPAFEPCELPPFEYSLADVWRLDPRFAAKLNVEAEAGCWYWTGATVKAGQGRRVPYGAVKRRGKFWLAHRYAHVVLIGPIPEGFEIHHTCVVRQRRTLCCNPRHLWALHPDDHDRIQAEEASYAVAA